MRLWRVDGCCSRRILIKSRWHRFLLFARPYPVESVAVGFVLYFLKRVEFLSWLLNTIRTLTDEFWSCCRQRPIVERGRLSHQRRNGRRRQTIELGSLRVQHCRRCRTRLKTNLGFFDTGWKVSSDELTAAGYWPVGRWIGVKREGLSDGVGPWDCGTGLKAIFSSVVMVDERLDGVCNWLRGAVAVAAGWSKILPLGTNWDGTGFVDAAVGYCGRNVPVLISGGRAWLIDLGSIRMICSINNSTRHSAARKDGRQHWRMFVEHLYFGQTFYSFES